jgi:hypothetical protein
MTNFFSYKQQQTFHDIDFSQLKEAHFKARAAETTRVKKW